MTRWGWDLMKVYGRMKALWLTDNHGSIIFFSQLVVGLFILPPLLSLCPGFAVRVWLQSYGTCGHRQLVRLGGVTTEAVADSRYAWSKVASISKFFFFMFLHQYIILSPCIAFSDMHFHTLHIICVPDYGWLRDLLRVAVHVSCNEWTVFLFR
jgi:hypothetical protein